MHEFIHDSLLTQTLLALSSGRTPLTTSHWLLLAGTKAVCPQRKHPWASLEHVPGSTERQVKCPRSPGHLLASTCLTAHSPVAAGSGAVLGKVLRAAKCPGVPKLGAPQGLWGWMPSLSRMARSGVARPASWETSQPWVLCGEEGPGHRGGRVLAYEGAEFVVESAQDLGPEQLDVVSAHR